MVQDALERADEIHNVAMDSENDATLGTDERRTFSDGGQEVNAHDTMEFSEDSINGGAEDELDGFLEDAPNYFEPAGSEPSSSESGDSDASSDTNNEEYDFEELLGQIPNGQIGNNPAIDIAATLPLFDGASLSMLSATLLILNCCRTHNVSNAFVNELLMLLNMSILPRGNVLPKSEYETSKMLKNFGLAYDIIHACPKGCVLFRGDLENEENCPECGSSRFRRSGHSIVPALVLRHFPLIPRLQ